MFLSYYTDWPYLGACKGYLIFINHGDAKDRPVHASSAINRRRHQDRLKQKPNFKTQALFLGKVGTSVVGPVEMRLFGGTGISFLGFLLLLMAVIAVPRGHYVLVVVDPWDSPQQIFDTIGMAGGTFVAPGRTPWIAVAYSETDGFPARLMGAGAILVLNHSLATGCRQKDT